MRALMTLLLCCNLTTAFAQSVNYKSVETTAGIASQLAYYATGKKDCSSSPPPSIKVVTAPKHGILTIKRGTVTTDKIANCPKLQTPANVLFYTAGAGYAGEDEIVYEVTDVNGQVALYDIKITIKESLKPAVKSPGNQKEQEL